MMQTPKDVALKSFPGIHILKEKEFVENPYSGEVVELEPEAVAVYDLAKGSEIVGNYNVLRDCIDWFIDYYPREYMILLD